MRAHLFMLAVVLLAAACTTAKPFVRDESGFRGWDRPEHHLLH